MKHVLVILRVLLMAFSDEWLATGRMKEQERETESLDNKRPNSDSVCSRKVIQRQKLEIRWAI